jgi:hypothetical protein
VGETGGRAELWDGVTAGTSVVAAPSWGQKSTPVA